MDFLTTVVVKSGLTKAQASTFVEALKKILIDEPAAGEKISLTGIGKLKVVEKATRMGVNPRTGEIMTIPAHKEVKFFPSKIISAKVK